MRPHGTFTRRPEAEAAPPTALMGYVGAWLVFILLWGVEKMLSAYTGVSKRAQLFYLDRFKQGFSQRWQPEEASSEDYELQALSDAPTSDKAGPLVKATSPQRVAEPDSTVPAEAGDSPVWSITLYQIVTEASELLQNYDQHLGIGPEYQAQDVAHTLNAITDAFVGELRQVKTAGLPLLQVLWASGLLNWVSRQMSKLLHPDSQILSHFRQHAPQTQQAVTTQCYQRLTNAFSHPLEQLETQAAQARQQGDASHWEPLQQAVHQALADYKQQLPQLAKARPPILTQLHSVWSHKVFWVHFRQQEQQWKEVSQRLDTEIQDLKIKLSVVTQRLAAQAEEVSQQLEAQQHKHEQQLEAINASFNDRLNEQEARIRDVCSFLSQLQQRPAFMVIAPEGDNRPLVTFSEEGNRPKRLCFFSSGEIRSSLTPVPQTSIRDVSQVNTP